MNRIEFGDCRDTMRRWAEQGIKAQTCVTSPPYFGLRSYLPGDSPDKPLEIGLEQTPEQYIAAMVEVFRCVRDVLADDGTLWLNIGDSYFPHNGSRGNKTPAGDTLRGRSNEYQPAPKLKAEGIKGKDLIGIPWMLAFALRADGWYLRQDIIWHKPNPMPESVRDRCTKAHEYIFLLSKSERYYFDNDSIRQPLAEATLQRDKSPRGRSQNGGGSAESLAGYDYTREGLGDMQSNPKGANKRSVWTVATRPYKGAHFATFPPALIEPCILAGSRPGDIVLDPFMGSGTTAAVALQHGRQYLGCELNPEYGPLQDERVAKASPAVVPQMGLFLEASA